MTTEDEALMADTDGRDQDDWLGAATGGSGPTGPGGHANEVFQRLLSTVGPVASAGWLTMGVGAVVAIIGYVRVSATSDVAQQLTRLSTLTAAGLFLAVIGAILIFSQHYQGSLSELRAYREEQVQAAALLSEREADGIGFGTARQVRARPSSPHRKA